MRSITGAPKNVTKTARAEQASEIATNTSASIVRAGLKSTSHVRFRPVPTPEGRSSMSDAVLIALLSGPAAVTLDRLISWLRNRNKIDAETGLTVDQRWQAWADELKDELKNLRERVSKLEDSLNQEQTRVKTLQAEVDRYKRIAKSLARHVLRLRDELAKHNADVPMLPSDVEDALTIIELP